MVPPRPSTMLRAMGRPRPVPVRRVVKYGSNTCDRCSGVMPVPRSLTRSRTWPSSGRSSDSRTAGDVVPVHRTRASRRSRASHGLSRVRQHVDQRRAQPFRVGRRPPAASSGISRSMAGPAADRRGGRRVLAQPHQIGRLAQHARRLGEIEHVVDDAIEPIDFLVDVLHRFADVVRPALRAAGPQRRLDDHQRVAHLVRDDRRQPPSDSSRSFCAASR